LLLLLHRCRQRRGPLTATVHQLDAAASTALAPERLRFNPRFWVETVEGVGVFLVSEDRSAVLTRPIHRALAPLVNGRRSIDDLERALADAFPPWETRFALTEMADRGYLASADTDETDDGELTYWSLAGVEPAAAGKALADAVVTVTALGDAGLDELAEALRVAGLVVGPGGAGALTVVAAEDYLDPALAGIDEGHRRDGRSWVLCKPVGATIWLGPLFVPGRTGCWHCLSERLTGNRPVEAYLAQRRGGTASTAGARARTPSTSRLAHALIAQQLRNAVAGIEPQALEGQVHTLDTRTLTFGTHPLVKRPQCPACGDPELVARRGFTAPALVSRPAVDASSHRSASIETTLARVARHVSPVTGAVKSVDPVFTDSDAVMHAYTAGHNFAVQYDGLAFLRRSLRMRSGGKGRTAAEARVGAICEALERYSGVYRGDEAHVRARYRDVAAEALHPNQVMLYSDRQYRDRQALNEANRHHTISSQLVPAPFDVDAEIDWTPLWSLVDGTRTLLPTGMCYFNYASYHGYRSASELFFLADSNGHAAGASLEDAALQGLLELIERDAVGIWWYNRLRRPAVDLGTVADEYVASLVARLDRLGRDVWALDLTTDLGVPVVCAASRRRTGACEELVFGFGAHVEPKAAVVRALVELVQFLATFERWGPDDENRYVAFDEAAARWWRSATLESEAYLAPADAPARSVAELPDLTHPDVLVELRTCIERVSGRGVPVYLLDQTRPDIDLPVVKVVAPGLRHMWARLGSGRLYDVPVTLGWQDRPLAEEELNPWAVFF
jgi:oxazoline/thiazoline synthase